MAILYAGKDQWAPECHRQELQDLLLPGRPLHGAAANHLSTTFRPDLRHDFVSYQWMRSIVTDWSYMSIQNFLSKQPKESQSRSPPAKIQPLQSKL